MPVETPAAATSQPIGRLAEEKIGGDAALERVRARLAQYGAAEILAVNGDIPVMATIAFGALPDCERFRTELAALPGCLDALDALHDAASAAVEADTRFAVASRPRDRTGALANECIRARRLLATALLALSDHGFFDGKKVRESLLGKSRPAIARDVITLATLFELRWHDVRGRTAVTEEMLRGARVLAEQLMDAVGAKTHGPIGRDAAADLRDRAFTYFVKTYDTVRRGIRFVRDSVGDAERVAPSLWSSNKRAPHGKARGVSGGARTDQPAVMHLGESAGGRVDLTASVRSRTTAADALSEGRDDAVVAARDADAEPVRIRVDATDADGVTGERAVEGYRTSACELGRGSLRRREPSAQHARYGRVDADAVKDIASTANAGVTDAARE